MSNGPHAPILEHINTDVIARFLQKVNKGGDNDCWLWIGAKTREGYGHLYIDNVNFRSHRVAFVIAHGVDPLKLTVCHNCPSGDNRLCCNPKHLWLGTDALNNTDRSRKGRSATGDRSGARLHPERRPRGENSVVAKLKTREVVQIRRSYSANLATKSELARNYGVSTTTIRYIIKRETWAHV